MSQELTKQESRTPETVEQTQWLAAPVDIYENSNELLLLADLPGVTADNLKIDIDNNELTVEGKRGEDAGDESDSPLPAPSYRRAFTLPSGIDHNKVAAEIKHGVLTLHLPKAEAIKPRRIEVSSG